MATGAAAATRKDRRLYVGNLPLNVGLSEKQIAEFIVSLLRQRGMIGLEEKEPIISVWVAPEGTYCFVEFSTVQLACEALSLTGTMLLNQTLRVSRPNNWAPSADTYAPMHAAAAAATPAGAIEPALAAAQAAAALAAAGSLSGNVYNTFGSVVPPQTPALGQAPVPVPMPAATLAAMPAAVPLASSTVIRCSNMLTPEELANATEREEVKEDVVEECKIFGAVRSIKVPVSHNPSCGIFVQFEQPSSAAATVAALRGRKFDGRVVGVDLISETEFEAIADGK